MKKGQSMFSSEELPVSLSAWRGLEAVSQTQEGTLHSLIAGWLIDSVLDGSSGKTYLVSCHPEEDETLAPSSGRWLNSGIASHGECWTLKTSESHSDAEECFLSDVLQEIGEIQPRYYLSPVAAAGILKRAERRKKHIPEELRKALQECVDSETTK